MKIEFDGTNGEEIANGLQSAIHARAKQSFQADTTVIVNKNYHGSSLSLSKVYGQGDGAQTREDMWRVPVGFTLNTATGEVTDKDDRVWAHEDLVEL